MIAKRSRLFPKCFKSNIYAVAFYDFATEQHPELKTNEHFITLCKHYTSLLCGLHFLNKTYDVEKLKTRFQRFVLLHYYSECDWPLLLQTFRLHLSRHSKSVLDSLSCEQDRIAFSQYQSELESSIFTHLDTLLSHKN